MFDVKIIMQYAISWTRTLKDFPKSFIAMHWGKKGFCKVIYWIIFFCKVICWVKNGLQSQQKKYERLDASQPDGKTFLFQIFLWNAVFWFSSNKLVRCPNLWNFPPHCCLPLWLLSVQRPWRRFSFSPLIKT